MDFPNTRPRQIEEIAREYLLAQSVYSPTAKQLSTIKTLIIACNPDKVEGDKTRSTPGVIHVPGATVAAPMQARLSSAMRWALTGVSSQYGLGACLRSAVNNGVVTHEYERGQACVHLGKVIEVTVGGVTIPGDVLGRSRRLGNFINSDHYDGAVFYRFRKGLIEVRDPDHTPRPPSEVERSLAWKTWTGRTLVVAESDQQTTIYRLQDHDLWCQRAADGFVLCEKKEPKR